MNEQAMVSEFHNRFGRPVGAFPGDHFDDIAVRKLRAALVFEEAVEFCNALGFTLGEVLASHAEALAVQRGGGYRDAPERPEPNLVECADAMCDLQYVTLGAADCFGIELAPLFREVHRSNMAKVGGRETQMGKILKPIGWQPPDIERGLRSQGWGA